MAHISHGLLLLLLIGIICIIPASAHPPVSVDLAYDAGAGILNVTIVHPVADNKAHYIREVLIEIPEKTILSKEYSSQPDLQKWTYSYQVSVPGGTSLKVTASCSQFGSLSTTLVTGEASQSSTPGTPSPGRTTSTSPGFTGDLALLAASAALGALVLHRREG